VTRAEAIEKLNRSADRIHKLGATALYVFGSVARDELAPDSDVDIFIDYDPDGPFSFVELIRLQRLLAQILERDVDLTTRAGLHPVLKEEIERSSIRVL
jgi:predicted nucleotidyltransferase